MLIFACIWGLSMKKFATVAAVAGLIGTPGFAADIVRLIATRPFIGCWGRFSLWRPLLPGSFFFT